MIGHSKHAAKGEHTLVSLLIGVCREWGRSGGLGRQEDLEEVVSWGHAVHTPHPLHLDSCALYSSCPDGLAQGSS